MVKTGTQCGTERTGSGSRVAVYTVLLVVVAVGAVTVATGGATAVQEESSDNSLVVHLEADGDAVVALNIAFDLTADDGQAGFEQLQTNETTQQELLDRYETRLASIADRTSSTTDRAMAVTEPQISTDQQGDVGVVTMSVSWERFAANDGETLTLGEPLASGFDHDGAVIVVPPESYAVTDATPDPAMNDDRAVWTNEQELTGFEAIVELVEDESSTNGSSDSDGDDGDTSDGSGDAEDGSADDEETEAAADDETADGFGALVAGLAAVLLGFSARRRN